MNLDNSSHRANVARMMVTILDIQDGNRIIDPTCGSGSFLIDASKINKNLIYYGIDKDALTAKVTRTYLSIMNLNSIVLCDNSLPNNDRIELNTFDVVIANPPFGLIIDDNIRSLYNPTIANYKVSHILFIEKCLQLLKPDGKLGVIIPDSVLSCDKYKALRDYLFENTTFWSSIITK